MLRYAYGGLSLVRRRGFSCGVGGGVAVAARRGHSALVAVGRAIVRRVAWATLAVLVLTTACSGLVSRGEPAEVREAAPAFTLPAHDGRTVSLSDLLARGPALVVFYRGHW